MLAASMEERSNPRKRVSANTERLLESFDENVDRGQRSRKRR